jgi:hypothetical protein
MLNKRTFKAVDAHIFSRQGRKRSADQKADGICFLGQERSGDGGFMQQGTTIKKGKEKNTLTNTLEAQQFPTYSSLNTFMMTV